MVVELSEASELIMVLFIIGAGLWLVDLIQRKTGHPLHDKVEDE